jgi:hypothetical protein
VAVGDDVGFAFVFRARVLKLNLKVLYSVSSIRIGIQDLGIKTGISFYLTYIYPVASPVASLIALKVTLMKKWKNMLLPAMLQTFPRLDQ